MEWWKWILVLAILGGTAFLVLHVSDVDPDRQKDWGQRSDWVKPTRRDTPITLKDSASCQSCHPEVFQEWMDSHHRIAYTNPVVQDLADGFQGNNVDCIPCHLPQPIPQTGFSVRPLERTTDPRHEEGVDCFTCHFWPEGNVMLAAGPLGPGAADAPCQPAVTPSISSMGLCAPCHNQHKVHNDWSKTRFAVQGPDFKDCNGCHMPEVIRVAADGSTRKGRNHRYPGAHDLEMLKSAATVTVTDAGASTLLVTIENSGTGHNFPADERYRAVDLHLVLQRRDGQIQDVRVDRFRNPDRRDFDTPNPLPELGSTYDKEIPLSGATLRVHAVRVAAPFNPVRYNEADPNPYPASTQIPAGEARSYRLELPSDVTRVTVRLWYRLNPFQADEDSMLLFENTVEPRPR
jgi:hypothetical protein